MKTTTLLFSLLLGAVISAGGCTQSKQETATVDASVYQNDGDQHILLFTKTDGFRHSSIKPSTEALKKMGQEKEFTITRTEDARIFSDDRLKEFDAVVFLNTTMTLFGPEQREAFQNYIRSGGGFAGIHSATDTEYDWEWYGELVGAYIANHHRNSNVRSGIVRSG